MVGYFIDRCAGTRGYSGLFLNQWSRCIRIIKCVKVGTSFLLGPHWLINWLNPRFGWLFSLLFFCPVVFAPCEGGLVGRRIWRKDIQLFPVCFPVFFRRVNLSSCPWPLVNNSRPSHRKKICVRKCRSCDKNLRYLKIPYTRTSWRLHPRQRGRIPHKAHFKTI